MADEYASSDQEKTPIKCKDYDSRPICTVSPNRLVRDWDCPDGKCPGHMEVFKAPNSVHCDKPAYARCSQSNSPKGPKCKLPVMFAKKDSTCAICKEPILQVLQAFACF